MATTIDRVHIVPGNLQSSPAIERRVDRRLAGVFRRFTTRVTGIKVYFDDTNGPKGGPADVRCVMEARVNGRHPVTVEGRSSDLYTAIDAAARKLGFAVARAVARRAASQQRRGRRAPVPGVTPPAAPELPHAPAAPPGRRAADIAPPEAPGADRPATATPPNDPNAGTGDAMRVIIAGFGPVGRALADGLKRRGVAITLIDANPATIRAQSALGHRVVHGDATDPAILLKAGIDRAAALAITIPDGQDAVRACRAARDLAPSIVIAARTNYVSQGLGALQAGANSVTVEEIATARAMADAVQSFFARPAPRFCEGAD